MPKMLETKKRLDAIEETKRLLQSVEGNQKPIVIITQNDRYVKEKLEKEEARVDELISALFSVAAEMDKRFLKNVLIDPKAATISRYKRDGVIEVIKRAGLYDAYRMWELDKYDK